MQEEKKEHLELLLPWTFMSNYLIEAVRSNNAPQVEYLLREGVELNVSDSFGNTPLWEAYTSNNHEIVFILLGAGINVNNGTGNHLQSDLHRACALASLPFVELLLACNGDVNLKDKFGKTPLFNAIQNTDENCVDIINVLVSRGADVNHQDKDGFSVLHYACLRNKLNVVNLLLYYNSNVFLLNRIGYSPLSYAFTNISFTPIKDIDYQSRLKIIERLLQTLEYNPHCIKKAILNNNYDNTLNITPLFDMIFYGNRVRQSKVIEIAWNIFFELEQGDELDRKIRILSKNLIQINKNNFDVCYYLKNMHIDDVYDMLTCFTNRFVYDKHLKRANILLYYCVNINFMEMRRFLNDKQHHLSPKYIFIFSFILSLVNKQPFKLKILSRIRIRNHLKYGLSEKVGNLMIPHGLKQFLMLEELDNLFYGSLCNTKDYDILINLLKKL